MQLQRCDLNKTQRALRQWLWFIETPLSGISVLILLSLASPLLVGLAGSGAHGSQVFLAWLFAAIILLYAYVPFLAILTSVINGRFPCMSIPGLFLIYLLLALQLAHAHVSFALFVGDEASFSGNICGSAVSGPCTMAAQSAWFIFLRMFYYASVTFVSVGYGDIAPQSTAATIAVFPVLWSPIFYLGILLGRIVADGSVSATAVQ